MRMNSEGEMVPSRKFWKFFLMGLVFGAERSAGEFFRDSSSGFGRKSEVRTILLFFLSLGREDHIRWCGWHGSGGVQLQHQAIKFR